jgi:hypothetical protein
MAKKNIKEKAQGKSETDLHEKIMTAYIDYVLMNGKDPASVYVFCMDNNITERQFYESFASFQSLDSEIWKSLVTKTIDTLHSNQEYGEYEVREKLLSFYYTLIEVLKKNRSYILVSYKNRDRRELKPAFLKGVREAFKSFIQSLLEEGMQSEEIKKRPYLSDKYDEALWLQFLFVLNFWIKDESAGFEKTDAAIEKAVKLSSEVMGEGPIDSFIDLAKFLYQNAR